MDLTGLREVCVAGWGKTGDSLVRLLLSLGKKVRVSEICPEKKFSSEKINYFKKQGVKFEFGRHSQKFISSCSLVLLSPGIDFNCSPLAEIIQKNKLPYMGEIEFASSLTTAKIIAITGTNGKTSTAYLVYLLLKKKKKNVFLAGNIGRPFSDIALLAKKDDIIILEVSSFQLETVIKFRPYVAVLLSVSPDHLQRHKSFQEYLKAKMKIFQNQKESDWAVVGKDNSFFAPFASRIRSRIAYYDNRDLSENFACARQVGKIFNISKLESLTVFSNYKNLPHRCQEVRVVNKVKFINDSKATNPASTFFALSQIKSKVILIAGGKDKGLDYWQLANWRRKVKKVNLIGEAAPKIEKDLNKKINCQKFSSLSQAVLSAYREAKPGETVLLSPMCASFDMFDDYRHRGKEFIQAVKSI